MKASDKREGFRRAAAMLCMMLGYAAGLFAKIPEPEVEVEGVRYRLDYYRHVYNQCLECIPYDKEKDLEYTTRSRMLYVGSDVCKAENSHESILQDRVFRFRDGSEIPAFEYITRVLSPNSPSNKEDLPRYNAEKDEMRKRYPYYTGEVWLQDSVLMTDLPDLRKKKYHIVCYFRGVKFNDELTFIRTPRYAVVHQGAFKDCTGLKTARIGAVQKVEGEAFENCTSLETVIFESVPLLEIGSFKNCPNISKVVVEGNCIDDNRSYDRYYDYFDKDVCRTATLYVRGDQIRKFRTHELWGRFIKIRDIEEYVSGVEEVGTDSAVEYRVYNLSGVLVRKAQSGQDWREGLPAGVYVVKSSLGNVRKEYVK